MILDGLRQNIQRLEQQLSELRSTLKAKEKLREECGSAVDLLKKYMRDQENARQTVYHILLEKSNTIKGTKFRRVYPQKIKEILFNTRADSEFQKLEDGILSAKSTYQDSEDEIAYCNRKIRETEDELYYSQGQLTQQEGSSGYVS